MPRNTGAGFIISAISLVLCFALVWHMWPMAIVSVLGVIVTLIARTYDRDVDYIVPAAEVAAIERARFALLPARIPTAARHLDEAA